MHGKVLILSDNAEAARVWAFAMHQRSLETLVLDDLSEALRRVPEFLPDIIIVDAYGMRLDGVEACRRLRRDGANPILLLNACGDESCCLRAYEAGVDECVHRPISPLLLLAKVHAWLRRSWTVPMESLTSLQSGPLLLEPAARVLIIDGRESLRLTNLELRLLHALMSQPGRALDSEYLIDRVWGYEGGDIAMLKNVVYRLRRKVQANGSRRNLIRTVPGKGYMLQIV